MMREFLFLRFAYTLNTGPDAPTPCGDFFIGCARDAPLKIHESCRNESRVSVRVYKARQRNFSCAIHFANSFAVLFDPGIAQGVLGSTHRNNFSSVAKYRAIFDDSEVV